MWKLFYLCSEEIRNMFQNYKFKIEKPWETTKSLRKVVKYLIHRLSKKTVPDGRKQYWARLQHLYILRVASIYPMCSRYIPNIQQLYVLCASYIYPIYKQKFKYENYKNRKAVWKPSWTNLCTSADVASGSFHRKSSIWTSVPGLRTTTAKNAVRQTHAGIVIRTKVYHLKTNPFPIRW